MIEVRNLTKYYGTLKALDDVSFTVKRGEVIGFLGPNGAGKTTAMRIICGYLSPTEGTAKVAGYDVIENPTEARKFIGYMPETVPLYNEMTVRSYLHYMAALRQVPKGQRKERVDYVVERCGLKEVVDNIIGTLSKGYRQRVGIAQALVHDPPVLVLDEPTIGLDPIQVVEVRQLIKELGNEHTVILSTHILPEVSMTCKRVLIIHRGRIVAEDTPDGLERRLRRSERILVRLLRTPEEAVSSLERLPNIIRVERVRGEANLLAIETRPGVDMRPQIAEHVVGKGWGLLELRRDEMTLEEIFLNIITREEVIRA
ncbi:MAG: ATP-binding cassette domain-containing protein [Armatimonadota bacterium]|nr:ABC transporter ATP-binding protein [Armatimonadota bacterium]MCX7776665.1 ABC transporter ATP-binding protein [Armatimonadota bacterium]MDW8025720.1 ATP-binding cassette domain-containing protein [Armatimonadota bacterium]